MRYVVTLTGSESSVTKAARDYLERQYGAQLIQDCKGIEVESPHGDVPTIKVTLLIRDEGVVLS